MQRRFSRKPGPGLRVAGLGAGLLCLVSAAPSFAQFVDVADVQVGSPTFAENLQEIDVASHTDGGFVVTWGEFGSTLGAGNRIVTHRYSRAGVEVAPPVRIDTSGYGLYPTITADHTGGFVGAWMWSRNGSPRALYARRLGTTGAGTGGEARIDNPDTGPMNKHAVAYRDAGPVYAWQQNGLWLRGYDPFGSAITPAVRVADYGTAFFLGVASLPGGGVVVTWINSFEDSMSWARLYDADLAPLGDAFAIEDDGVVDAVAASDDGEFAVVGFRWFDDATGGAGGARSETWMRRFAADGTPLGDRQIVRTTGNEIRIQADVDYDSRGNLLVVWREWDAVAEVSLPARARAYGPGGEPLGPDFTLSEGLASEVRTTALADDCFASAWYHHGKAWANVTCLCPGTGTCGDGSVDGSCELCDDGNLDDGDGCDSNCTPTACGNGVVSAGEECDDGNDASGDGCDANCRATGCGNGVVTAGEQCDDGNAVNDDGCDANCRPSGCGNGAATGDEECDDGNAVDGDGCDTNCTPSACGNGIAAGGEACDDGNLASGDGCDANCTASACGNGIRTGEEECDDGGRASGDGCDANCLVEACGNGRREDGEPCDSALEPEPGAGACNDDCTLRDVHDSVVFAVRPVAVSIPVGNAPFTKNVQVQVQNADVTPVRESPGHAIRLVMSDGDCPVGTVTGQPDFDRGAPGVQDTVVLSGGVPATAIADVTVSRDAFTPFDKKIPTRCHLRVTASEATGASDDPTPDNNTAPVALDVTDTGDSAHSGLEEFFVASMDPVTVKIAKGQASVTKQIKPAVRRSRDLPTDAGDLEVVVSASDGDCPPGTVGYVDTDRRTAGYQSRLVLRRGKRAKGSLGLVIRADAFTTPSDESPRRCTALVTATGTGDTDPSNNTTRLVIDVYDRNDY